MSKFEALPKVWHFFEYLARDIHFNPSYLRIPKFINGINGFFQFIIISTLGIMLISFILVSLNKYSEYEKRKKEIPWLDKSSRVTESDIDEIDKHTANEQLIQNEYKNSLILSITSFPENLEKKILVSNAQNTSFGVSVNPSEFSPSKLIISLLYMGEEIFYFGYYTPPNFEDIKILTSKSTSLDQLEKANSQVSEFMTALDSLNLAIKSGIDLSLMSNLPLEVKTKLFT